MLELFLIPIIIVNVCLFILVIIAFLKSDFLAKNLDFPLPSIFHSNLSYLRLLIVISTIVSITTFILGSFLFIQKNNIPPIALPPKATLEDSIKAKFTYYIPQIMIKGHDTTVILMITPAPSNNDTSNDINLKGIRDTTVVISNIVQAKLIDPTKNAFDINLENDNIPTRIVNNSAPSKWIWNIKPKDAGSQRLILYVLCYYKYRGKRISDPIPLELTTQQVTVKKDYKDEAENWLDKYGNFLWGSILVPVFLWWLAKRNKKNDKKDNDELQRKKEEEEKIRLSEEIKKKILNP